MGERNNVRRFSKTEASQILKVSISTVDRMIARRDLEVELEPHGTRHRVWVLLQNDTSDTSHNGDTDTPIASEGTGILDSFPPVSSDTPLYLNPDASADLRLAAALEHIEGLGHLLNLQRERLGMADALSQELTRRLATSQVTVDRLAPMLRPVEDIGRPEPPWWRFW